MDDLSPKGTKDEPLLKRSLDSGLLSLLTAAGGLALVAGGILFRLRRQRKQARWQVWKRVKR